MPRRGDIGHLARALGQELGDAAAHVIVVEIEHQDRRLKPRSGGDIVGREDAGPDHLRRRDLHRGIEIRRPPAAGRDDDMLAAEFENVLDREAALQIGRDVGQPVDLAQAIVDDPPPGGKAGQPRFEEESPAPGSARLGESHRVSPFT